MTSRRDWQLQQLGITQWVLRRPAVLQGEVAVTLPGNTRLVIVAAQLPALDAPFIDDVLRSLSLRADQVMSLTPDRVAMLPAGSECPTWWLGDAPSSPALSGVQLCSPSLDELYQNPQARQALWKQICQNEDYFFPDAG